ncbi:hypothetical protein AB0K71_10890 [Streptomyces syringium]|uniref:hypothetical protein n=1 Tax=Streptomyces syringium TaxID=76729 RepID=UPI0034228A34
MLRHVSPPTRFFTQVSNEIIRHPRLSAAAVRLLTWQLSLPDGADEALGVTAERAGIKKTAFTQAKRELVAEGYLHEWSEQVEKGQWVTVQLISNVPLTAEEATAERNPGASPTAAEPTVGEPTPRSVGRSQEETCRGDHRHPYLFRPVDGETLCRDCRQEQAAEAQADASGVIGAALRGGSLVRAALRGGQRHPS